MCGRFTLRTSPRKFADLLRLPELPGLTPRYNVAPTQQVLAVRNRPDQAGYEAALLHWGLIPSWAKDPTIASSLINARSETAATKPAFCAALRSRRCLIPADGFYEWKKQGKQRQPYLIERQNGEPYAYAGLWECWQSPAGPFETCTILTTQANARLSSLHHRMPVILLPADFESWLNPAAKPDELTYLFEPLPDDELTVRPVSPFVNNARHESAECVAPFDTESDMVPPAEPPVKSPAEPVADHARPERKIQRSLLD